MKKIILFTLVLSMYLTVACEDAELPSKGSNEHYMKELQDDVKFFGRVGFVETAAAFDWSASGFEMNVNAVGGKFIVKYSFSYASYFVVFVDGIRIARPLLSGKNGSFDFDLPPGAHTIRIVKDSSISTIVGSFNCFNSIFFAGEILERPADKELLIEFFGASTTCGSGALGVYNPGIASTKFEVSATQAFPYFVCEALDADHSFTSVGSTGFVEKSGGQEDKKNLVELYPYISGYRSTTELYSPSRVPDVVVLGPITIDLSVARINRYLSTMMNFVETLRRDYGPDTKIVWLGRTGHEKGLAIMNEIILSTKDPNLFAMTPLLQYVGKGSGGAYPVHPNVNEHKEIAEAVTTYLKETVGIKNDHNSIVKSDVKNNGVYQMNENIFFDNPDNQSVKLLFYDLSGELVHEGSNG